MNFDLTRFEQWRAFLVHILTATGAFFAFLSLIAAGEGRFVDCFLWLGVGLFVDGIDGPIARKFDIKRRLPNWSGDMLDSVIDYSTFSLIPAVALYHSGIIGRPLSFVAAALIVITSAIYYADLRMKTKDNFFRGFPVCWNMLVFTLFAIHPNELTAFVFVALCAFATFLPIKFLHPVRVTRLRPLNLTVFALWSLLGIVALFQSLEPSFAVKAGLVVTGLYLFAIGGVLQVYDRIRGRNDGEDETIHSEANS
ncbi:phosphatidylcholine/phosphatidylserine synthase [Fulvimarina endophytica]|uniref:Phosphatidylcholine synthase n=1 Tax=Fulvimarina endophytica TaxID=2293836 RepID=A0A371WZF0_9HYPH|nr:phosphatidylcholine/phosphatidylserine synthase [Fulvimarina endophytica]RFC62358.1 phosphatidylcholine/phosphatidylserine synthase [Fulvimarina endophytica]